MYTLILATFIVLLAAFVRGISGFGFALLATPLLTFIFDAKSVVVMNVILGTTTNVLVLFHMRRHIDFRRVAFISLGGVLGVPLGAYLLSWLDPLIVKLAIAIVVVPMSLILLLGHSHQFKRDTLGCSVAGFMSGILAASTSLGGPPVVLFLLNQGLVTEMFVGTLAAYFLFIGSITIGVFSSLGLITTDLLTKVAILLPALFLGSYAGVKVLPKINVTLFKRITSSIICISALVIILSILVEL